MRLQPFVLFVLPYLVPVLTIAQTAPKQPHLEAVQPKNCEFVVSFPSKTFRKRVFANGIESEMIQNVYEDASPFMRVECLPIAERSETVTHYRKIIEDQARQAGISSPEITIGEDKGSLGLVGTYSGFRQAGGHNLRVYGKFFLGRRSLLMLLLSEPAQGFPSDKAVLFLNGVSRK